MKPKTTTSPVKQREIKFRAYHKAAKIMMLVNRIDWSTTGDKVDDAIWSIEGIDRVKTENGKDKTTFLSQEDFILMQFTGLLDKNGKEIYEGDIYLPRDGVKRIIEFKDGCFAEKNSFPTFRIELGGEVIGNIYENPELLKGTYG